MRGYRTDTGTLIILGIQPDDLLRDIDLDNNILNVGFVNGSRGEELLITTTHTVYNQITKSFTPSFLKIPMKFTVANVPNDVDEPIQIIIAINTVPAYDTDNNTCCMLLECQSKRSASSAEEQLIQRLMGEVLC